MNRDIAGRLWMVSVAFGAAVLGGRSIRNARELTPASMLYALDRARERAADNALRHSAKDQGVRSFWWQEVGDALQVGAGMVRTVLRDEVCDDCRRGDSCAKH